MQVAYRSSDCGLFCVTLFPQTVGPSVLIVRASYFYIGLPFTEKHLSIFPCTRLVHPSERYLCFLPKFIIQQALEKTMKHMRQPSWADPFNIRIRKPREEYYQPSDFVPVYHRDEPALYHQIEAKGGVLFD